MKHWSIGEVAKICAVPAHRIVYAHQSGKLPEPGDRICGKRVYNIAELISVGDFFGTRVFNMDYKKEEGCVYGLQNNLQSERI